MQCYMISRKKWTCDPAVGFIPAAWSAGSTGNRSGRRGGWSERRCWWRWPCTAWAGSCPPGAAAAPRWRRWGRASSRRPTGTRWACPETFPPAAWSTAPCGGCPDQTAPSLREGWGGDGGKNAHVHQVSDDAAGVCLTLWLIEQRELRIDGGSWEGRQAEEVFLQQGDVGLLVHSWHVLSERDEEEDPAYFL